MIKTKIALGFRPAFPQINSPKDKLTFGKYKGQTVDQVIRLDANYILWMSDEKIAQVSEEVLKYAEEADVEQRLDEATGEELRGMRYWDFFNDD